MSTVDRHEARRADWILAHEAGWHLSDRRMANALKRRAARKDRTNSGSAESSHHEGRIKWIGSRFISHRDDSGEQAARWVVLYVFVLPVLAVLIGPAIALALILYAIASTVLLRFGLIPRSWPWVIAAIVATAAGFFVLDVDGLVTVSPDLMVDFAWTRIGALYFGTQLVVALYIVAWNIRRHGWPGVKITNRPKTPTMPSLPTQKAKNTQTVDEQSEPSVDGPKAPSLPVAPSIPEPIDADDRELDDDDPIFDDEPFVDPNLEEEKTND